MTGKRHRKSGKTMAEELAEFRAALAALGRAALAPAVVLPLACVWLAYATGCAVWFLWLPLAGLR